MRQKILYCIWGCLYILCVGLGTLTQRSAGGEIILTALAVIFFIPGGILLYDGLKTGDKVGILRIRVICLTSLILTLAALVANILSARGSEALGNVLYDLLILVSAPMLCSKYWALTIFLWSCLLIISFPRLWKPHSGNRLKDRNPPDQK